MSDDLTSRLLAKPIGPATVQNPDSPDLTKAIEVRGDVAEVTVNTATAVDEYAGFAILEENGLNCLEWQVTGFRASEWTQANGNQGTSTRFTFTRKASIVAAERPNLDELIAEIVRHTPREVQPAQGEYGFLVLLGDMQFGKIDGDGVEGTLRRTIEGINAAADVMWEHARRFPIGHVHVGFLGDHVEGFQSQGGANVWRTPLTLSEQIRLTRRVMLHAMLTFADAAEQVSIAAVPGNHGETTRFAGKGVTRYDDSHDTESLIAVADAAALNPSAFGHVKFYVPDTDQLTVTTEVAGTKILHAHGHQFRPGKHFDWWRGQAFHNPTHYAADLLAAGHLHHLFVEEDGERMFLQVPSFESESTWFKHRTGIPGNPGLVVAITKDGKTNPLEVVR